MTLNDVLATAAELFNRKHYFECHDVLEDAWSDARGRQRDFLQALVHLAVGMYHVAAGNQKGARSQLGQAIRGLEPFVPEHEGLAVESLIVDASRCLTKLEKETLPEWTAEDIPEMKYRRLV